MENLIRTIVFVVLAAALGTGCRSAPRARIVRLVREGNTLQWNLSVNGGRLLQVSSYDVTNKLSRMELSHGDVALLGTPPGGDLWDWIKAYFDSNPSRLNDFADRCGRNGVGHNY